VTDEAYLPSPSRRATKAEVAARRASLLTIVGEMRPMTVRQVFYQATVRGLVEKTEAGYDKVNGDLCVMRRAEEMPYEWLVDNTRWVLEPQTFDSVEEALRDAAEHYRKSLWSDAKCRVQIWIEKDALSGVVSQITNAYDVPLRPARGYSSLTFLHDAAEDIIALGGVPVHIYHFGDFDPSGVNAAECIEDDLREMTEGADIRFERVAVTEEQIRRWSLPTRPTKQTDTRARSFGSDRSVELDAIPPNTLRGLVRQVIERHMPRRRLKALMAQEERERSDITRMVNLIQPWP
jgi:hypothetical protein